MCALSTKWFKPIAHGAKVATKWWHEVPVALVQYTSSEGYSMSDVLFDLGSRMSNRTYSQ